MSFANHSNGSPSRGRPRISMSRLKRDMPNHAHYQSLAIDSADDLSKRRNFFAKKRKPHVVVVGAGVSGLRCADVLLQHGCRVTVLEARNRVGGRLAQGSILGNLVDLGPNWIHGTDDNPILDLAKKTKTITHSWDDREMVYDPDGTPAPTELVTECSEVMWEIIEEGMDYSHDHCESIPSSRSLWDYFQEQAAERYPDDDRKRQTLLRIADMWGAFVGSPIQRQSFRFFWLEKTIDGENLFVAETYKKVLDSIAAPVLERSDVKFEHEVTAVRTVTDSKDHEVVIIANGKHISCDEVVVTTPLGWLKSNLAAFEPGLPARLQQAIGAISYGCLDKVYITFPAAFWDTPSTTATNLTSTSSHHSTHNVTATTAPLRQPTTPEDDRDSDHAPGFDHWTKPTYAHDTNPQQWHQQCMNMAALPGPTAHPTLLFYIFGPTSQHIASIIRDHPSPAVHTPLILSFFLPYYSRLPNYSASSPSCQPLGILATAWANDKFAGYGSYSNFQIGLEKGDGDIEVIRKGCPERGLWMAGEHTAPFVALGTVTGAYWSGEEVAKRIVRMYEIEKEGATASL